MLQQKKLLLLEQEKIGGFDIGGFDKGGFDKEALIKEALIKEALIKEIGQNLSKRIDPGCSSYPTKYGLTIFYGDPFHAPGHFRNYRRFPEKSFKSTPRGSRDSRSVIFPINGGRKLPISDIGLP